MKNKQERIKQAKEYIKTNIWKRFFKYKLIELVGIPLGGFAFWKLPLWTGWGLVKLFDIDVLNNTVFCVDKNAGVVGTLVVCNGTDYKLGTIWFFGFFALAILFAFIYGNLRYAKEKLKEEAKARYGKIVENGYSGNVNDLDKDI